MALVATSAWLTGLGIPALLAVGGFVAWGVRSTIEDYRAAERELTEQRRALYQLLLEPLLLPLITPDDQNEGVSERVTEMVSSTEYRRALFEVSLYASDEVVRALGDVVNSATNPELPPMMVLWSQLIVAIRKSVGNKGTRLTQLEVLRPMINDADVSAEFRQLFVKPR